MRALIVNADDFGLTAGVNAGILEAHTRGILTSASLFANAPATDEAVQIARSVRTLGVGCHLTLVDGMPILPAHEVPTLAPDGRFRSTWAAFLRDAIRRRVEWNEVDRELTAQIDRLRSEGLRPTHLDGHKHVHAYPPVFRIVARLARRFGVASIRVPCETPALRLAIGHAFTGRMNRQAIENLAIAPWAWRDRALLRRDGLPPAPRFLGRIRTGLWTPAAFRALLRSLPAGVSELMMHPGYPDAALDRVPTRLRAERAEEVSLLTDSASADLIGRNHISLVNHLRIEPRYHVA
jgi:hopanoid biosynthesis associated protein HpnK